MKKYNLYLWLAALVGLFASCSQDENAMLQTNESNRVSLTAELPDDFAQIGTRSVPSAPDGNHKLRCILEVWNSELNALIVRQEAAPENTDDITFSFKLEQTGDYQALLWADYIPSDNNPTSVTIANLSDVLHFKDEYYKTNSETGLQAVARIKGEMTNPDLLDAFFVCEPFTKEATALNDLSATLVRPFTKLTIAEKNSTNNFGYCETVKATAIIPTQIDVATGNVSAPQATTMWDAAPSGAEITVGGSPSCKTLFSTYILATADGTMQNIELVFTATEEIGKTLKNVTIPAGVPAKRNYRVNAAGNLIQAEDVPSDDAKMTVEIKADWATDAPTEEDLDPKVGDYYYKDGTWSAEIKNNEDNPIIGVVFQVYSSDDSRYGKARGKVISPKEETNIQWSTKAVQTGVSSSDGKENTDKILDAIDQNTYKAEEYPIFNACKALRTETENDGWYIPAREYTAFFGNGKETELDRINAKIGAIGGGVELIKPTSDERATNYWLSSEGSDGNGQYGAQCRTSDKYSGQDKASKCKVRFILEF